MKFTLATLALASVAYSQTIASETAMLPSCALTCLSNAITGAGCDLTDYTCQCTTQKNAITTSATPCVVSACSTSDALKVQSITSEICTLAAAAGSGSSSAAGSSTAASSSATSSMASSMSMASTSTSAAMSAASSASSKASSVASSVASAASSATSSAAAQVTGNAGSKVDTAGLLGAAAMLAAFAI